MAVRDAGSIVEFVMGRRQVEKVNLMGWSWETHIMGFYTTTHNANVRRLVLYAPGWLSKDKVPPDAPPLTAYRTVTREEVQARWLTGVPDDKKATLIPPGWFDMFADVAFATDKIARWAPSKIRTSFVCPMV
jgi:pimeloyl-ACP methyl ester carboxylesterase